MCQTIWLVQWLLETPNVCVLSHVQLFAAPWTVAHQALLSMRFSSAMGFPGGDSGLKKKNLPANAGGTRDVETPKC